MRNQTLLAHTAVLKAISNATRLDILHQLNGKELSVKGLQTALKLGQSTLSQHLAVLRHSNVVKTRRSAQTIYYSINSRIVQEILKILQL